MSDEQLLALYQRARDNAALRSNAAELNAINQQLRRLQQQWDDWRRRR